MAPGPSLAPEAPPAPIDNSIKPLSDFLREIETENRDISGLPENKDFADMLGASMDDIDALERVTELIREENDALDERAAALLASLDPMEQLRQQTEELDVLLANGRLTQEQYAEALGKIRQEALLASETLEGGFARALEGLEDSLSSIDWFAGDIFKQMGKAFKGMVNDIINEAFRLMVIKPLLKQIFGDDSGGGGSGGIFGAFMSAAAAYMGGAKAGGGPVTANTPYLVGEKGPEVFVPGASGGIVPNHKMGGGSIVNQTINIHYDATLESMDTRIRQSVPMVARAAAAGIANDRQRVAASAFR